MNTQIDTGRINVYTFRIRQLIESSHPYILHFDCTVGDLCPWFWPITDGGERVTPEDLASYRASGFRRPCCLCAVPERNGASIGYTESMVILDLDGRDPGMFTLVCAKRKCSYIVPLERAYVSIALPLKRYTRLYHAAPVVSRSRRMAKAKRRDVVCRIRCSIPVVVNDPPSIKLARLNSFVYPGLPEEEFRALFTKCSRCSWIMARHAFKYHKCPRVRPAPVEVIDLTIDREDVIDLTMDREDVIDLTIDREDVIGLTMDIDEVIDLTMDADDSEVINLLTMDVDEQ